MTDATILAKALAQSDPLERARFLGEACASDPAFRQSVEQILAATPAPIGSPLDASSATWAAGKAPKATADPALAFLAPPGRPDSLGRLGHYDVLEVLGQGGFGMVFRAFDGKLARVVALKVMRPEIATTSPARSRFLREARAAAPIRDEHVVSVYATESEPLPYIVMEFIPGQTLQQRLDGRGPLAAAEVVALGGQLARGLAAAHAIGVIHRDIKPANVMVEDGDDVRVKITDFGLARAADDASLTQSGVVSGTPLYMSPEQARGDAVDHRSDLFSLGSVLYTMVAGRPAFRADSSQAVLRRVAEDRHRPIAELIPETPPGLIRIIDRLLEKDPARRYATALEVARDLETNGLDATPTRPARAPRERRWSKWWFAIPAALALTAAGVLLVGLILPPHFPHGPTWTNRIGMSFTKLPKGSLRLDDRTFEQRATMYIGTYEVTQREWLAIMDANPSEYSRGGKRDAEVRSLSDEEIARLPVERVSFHECQEYCRLLNERHLMKGWRYRLPTADEWAYAARGGPDAPPGQYPVDDEVFPTKGWANLKGGPGRPMPVGSFAPNRLGLYDMAGNVFEICGPSRPASDGRGKIASIRGGCWLDPPDFTKVVIHNHTGVDFHLPAGGFRVVLEFVR